MRAIPESIVVLVSAFCQKQSGGKTGGKNAQRVSYFFDKNGQECIDLSMNDPLDVLERLISSGSTGASKGLQLSPISTTHAACRASLQAAPLCLGAKWGASDATPSSNVPRTRACGENQVLPHLPENSLQSHSQPRQLHKKWNLVDPWIKGAKASGDLRKKRMRRKKKENA